MLSHKYDPKYDPQFLQGLYDFFIAEFDARTHNLPLFPKISDPYKHALIDKALELTSRKASDSQKKKIIASVNKFSEEYFTPLIKESSAHIYFHIKNLMKGYGSTKKAKITRCLDAIAAYIRSNCLIVVAEMTRKAAFEKSIESIGSLNMSTKNTYNQIKWKTVEAGIYFLDENKLIVYVTPGTYFHTNLLDPSQVALQNVLFYVHPGQGKTWYVRGAPLPGYLFLTCVPLTIEIKKNDGYLHHSGGFAGFYRKEKAIKYALLSVENYLSQKKE
jgi:hypothetical protein